MDRAEINISHFVSSFPTPVQPTSHIPTPSNITDPPPHTDTCGGGWWWGGGDVGCVYMVVGGGRGKNEKRELCIYPSVFSLPNAPHGQLKRPYVVPGKRPVKFSGLLSVEGGI